MSKVSSKFKCERSTQRCQTFYVIGPSDPQTTETDCKKETGEAKNKIKAEKANKIER